MKARHGSEQDSIRAEILAHEARQKVKILRMVSSETGGELGCNLCQIVPIPKGQRTVQRWSQNDLERRPGGAERQDLVPDDRENGIDGRRQGAGSLGGHDEFGHSGKNADVRLRSEKIISVSI